MKKITFSADDDLIDLARLVARSQHKTLNAAYVQRAKRKRFAAEARRQSQLVAGLADESEVMNWIQDVSGKEC